MQQGFIKYTKQIQITYPNQSLVTFQTETNTVTSVFVSVFYRNNKERFGD